MPTSAESNSNNKALNYIKEVLAATDVTLNGDRPWDIQVHDPATFAHSFLTSGSLGLGENYMNHVWDCPNVDQMITRLLINGLDEKIKNLRTLWYGIRTRIFNHQTQKKAWEVGQAHYDIGNDFFQRMLDPYMTYTCGYWRNADNLNDAQQNKLELICQKLNLKSGMKILDIGCGWGSFMRYAAEHYGVECVGITISKEQIALGQELCKGLPITFHLQDYRELNEKFDAVVSVGMFEHVGRKNYRTYFEVARRVLKPEGLFLLHTIGGLIRDFQPDPWINKYIFPNGELPSMGQIIDATQRLFVVEDVQNIGVHYDKTLMAWHKNFENNWHLFKDQYGDKFYRMWRYYLLVCAATFRSRSTQVWQFVLSPNGLKEGYQRPFL